MSANNFGSAFKVCPGHESSHCLHFSLPDPSYQALSYSITRLQSASLPLLLGPVLAEDPLEEDFKKSIEANVVDLGDFLQKRS